MLCGNQKKLADCLVIAMLGGPATACAFSLSESSPTNSDWQVLLCILLILVMLRPGQALLAASGCLNRLGYQWHV